MFLEPLFLQLLKSFNKITMLNKISWKLVSALVEEKEKKSYNMNYTEFFYKFMQKKLHKKE